MFANLTFGLSVLAVVVAVAACAPSAPAAGGPRANVAPPSPHSLIPAVDGLDVTASGGRQIGFGRDQLGVLQTVPRVTGTAPGIADCSAPNRTAYGTDSGLTLVFERGAFVGWQTAGAAAGRGCT